MADDAIVAGLHPTNHSGRLSKFELGELRREDPEFRGCFSLF